MTTPETTHARFGTTCWTMVLEARDDPVGLDRLLRAYWSPIYAYVRGRGYSAHDASDLTQQFLAQIVLGRSFLERADPRRGRFRAFLKASLRNFLIDQHRRGRREPLNARRVRGIDPSGARMQARDEPEGLDRSSTAFDRQWAAALLAVTVDRLAAACREDGLGAHWEAFRLNVLLPATRGTAPLSMEALAGRVGAANEAQASNMIQTVKRRIRAALRQAVAETVSDPAQVESELEDLKHLLR